MDDRPTITTARPVDLAALTAELGVSGLSSRDDDGTTTIVAPTGEATQAELQAAVDAHVPPTPDPSPDDRLDNLVAALATASTLADVRQAAAAARPRR